MGGNWEAYVAFSRVKNFEGLHILNFNDKAIKASDDTDMHRLNNNLLSPLPLYTCPDNYNTIALLNVRSLILKLPDVNSDPSLAAASILCFTETWLSPPIETPDIRGNCQTLRADHGSGERKGGVLISLPENVEVREWASLDGEPIEGVLAVLRFPSGDLIHMTVVYRSPSVSTSALLQTMTRILSLLHLQVHNMISIIMGGFNEDLLTNPKSKLATLMSQWGYSQLVHTPTTDKGTLIDHVYCNCAAPAQCVDIHVADVYYSDHDAVLCSIPRSNET